jgi:hypothetical protein
VNSEKPLSPVRLLSSCSGTSTTELLWLASSWVSNEKASIELEELSLEVSLLLLRVSLTLIGDDSLGECESDGVELGDETTTSDSDSDVHLLEDGLTEQEIWLEDLVSEDWGSDQLEWNTVDSKSSLTTDAAGNSKGVSPSAEGLHDDAIVLLLGLAHQS